MIKCIFLFATTILFFSTEAQEKQKTYQLVWNDEFNSEGRPDTANWVYERGFVRNQEFQFYQTENAYCTNGNLVIEARKENKPNPGFLAGTKDWRKNRPTIDYSSACILTKGLHSWQYGRFELRAKIDISAGLWPAWWTLGNSGNWPGNGEIDILEFYRGMLLANVACMGSDLKPEWLSNRFSTDSLGGAKWASLFHTWRMDWDENGIELFLDDQQLLNAPMDKLNNKDGSGSQPFKQPHYMLINLAIGGQNGGDPSRTAFPARYEIDYVRVYQRK
ncbi:MAG: hypothetical protein RLZZ28_1620 [Bacteroidota bacterium]|jgi:beta-glucanase (GH16 family)